MIQLKQCFLPTVSILLLSPIAVKAAQTVMTDNQSILSSPVDLVLVLEDNADGPIQKAAGKGVFYFNSPNFRVSENNGDFVNLVTSSNSAATNLLIKADNGTNVVRTSLTQLSFMDPASGETNLFLTNHNVWIGPFSELNGGGIAGWQIDFNGDFNSPGLGTFENGLSAGNGSFGVDGSGNINGRNVTPSSADTYDIGATGNRWRVGYFNGLSVSDSISAANDISSSTGTFSSGVETEGLTNNGAFKHVAGANNGYVMTSDASGNGSWQPAPAGGSGNFSTNANGSARFIGAITNDALTASRLVATDSNKKIVAENGGVTSAGALASFSDETGTGNIVFNNGAFHTNTTVTNLTWNGAHVVQISEDITNNYRASTNEFIIIANANNSVATNDFTISLPTNNVPRGFNIRVMLAPSPNFIVTVFNEIGNIRTADQDANTITLTTAGGNAGLDLVFRGTNYFAAPIKSIP